MVVLLRFELFKPSNPSILMLVSQLRMVGAPLIPNFLRIWLGGTPFRYMLTALSCTYFENITKPRKLNLLQLTGFSSDILNYRLFYFSLLTLIYIPLHPVIFHLTLYENFNLI